MESSKNRLFLIIILVLSSVYMSYSQDYKQVIIKINQAYENLNGTIIDAKLQLFNSFTSTKPIEDQNLNIHRKGDSYIYRMGSSEIIRNNTFFLLVDNNNQVMILDSATKQQEEPQYLHLSRLDSTLHLYKKVELTNINNETGRLTFIPGIESVNKFEIYYNKSSYQIEKIVFYLYVNNENGTGQSPARVEINYTGFRTNINFPQNEFSISRFIRMNGRNAVLLPAYSGYKLHNHLIVN